jgi:hypothetical protein
MAAARHIPRTEAVWPITFLYNGTTLTVSTPAIIIAPGDEVNFANSPSSTAAINITFAANPPGVINPPGPALFSNITGLQPGATDGLATPSGVNGSVNYKVTAGGQTFGPYAIQAGTGPLYVTINNSNSAPDPVLIPVGGTLKMYSTDGNTYNPLTWTPSNPFTTPAPGLTQVNPGASNNLAYTDTPKLSVPYTYNFPVQSPKEGLGTGKIHVQ